MADGDGVVAHQYLFDEEPQDLLAFNGVQGLGALAQPYPKVGERLDQPEV
jgi:hypothetical protein